MHSNFSDPILLARLYQMFREFFDLAERKRRWSIRDDIPWNQCSRALDPIVADVVETFCSVELYLPDYLSKLLTQVRAQRGRAWFLANWGYEESKHSMALGDWLLRSGMRTEEQMADLEARVFAQVWDPPYADALGMVCYTMLQEIATFLHYRNLRRVVREGGGDPALETVLGLVGVDERAHYDFFRRVVGVYLEYDRPATLEMIRRVSNEFTMPVFHMLEGGVIHAARVRDLHIFDEHIYFFEVLEPSLAGLGLTKRDLKQRQSKRELVTTGK